MHGLLADQGVGNLVWSPLGGGIVARPWGDESTTRAGSTPEQGVHNGAAEPDCEGQPCARLPDHPSTMLRFPRSGAPVV